MKKIILLAGLLFSGLAQAQLIEVTGNGEPISNGETFTFNTIQPQSASELKIVVTNVSGQPINLKLRMDNIENNSSGEPLQFCFGGFCFTNVNEGGMVPPNLTGLTLQPGANNGDADHFWNAGPGDTAGPVSYQMSIVRLDAAGVVQETLISFNYIYQPTMGVDDLTSLQSAGITISNTIIKDQLTVTATQQTTMEVYSLNGKLLETASIAEGSQSVDLSALSAAVYIAKFTNKENQSSAIRIVKQ
jgi:hypothetical protein